MNLYFTQERKASQDGIVAGTSNLEMQPVGVSDINHVCEICASTNMNIKQLQKLICEFVLQLYVINYFCFSISVFVYNFFIFLSIL